MTNVVWIMYHNVLNMIDFEKLKCKSIYLLDEFKFESFLIIGTKHLTRINFT